MLTAKEAREQLEVIEERNLSKEKKERDAYIREHWFSTLEKIEERILTAIEEEEEDTIVFSFEHPNPDSVHYDLGGAVFEELNSLGYYVIPTRSLHGNVLELEIRW